MRKYWSLLYQASQIFLSQQNEEIILDTLCNLMVSQLDFRLAWIGLIEEGSYAVQPVAINGPGQEYLNHVQITWDDSDLGRGPTGTAIRAARASVTNQIEIDPAFTPWRSKAMKYGFLSSAAVPLLYNDHVLGTLNVYSAEANHFTEERILVLQSLANLTATAIKSARLFKAQQAAQMQSEALRVATEALIKTLDLEQVLHLILSELHQVVPYDTASILQTVGGEMKIIGSYGFPNPDMLEGITFDIVTGDNPNRKIAQSRTALILNDPVKTYSDFNIDPYAATIRSWLGVPLLFSDQMLGMLTLDSHEPDFYTEDHAQAAMAFAARAAIAINNAQLYDQLRTYADELEERVASRTQELENANLRLQELDRLKSKFVSDVSHELRTPITNLLMYLDLLGKGNPEKIEKYLAVLKDQAARLAQLIESILDLSRLDVAKDKPAEFETVDFNEAVEQVIIAHIPRAKMTNLHLHSRLADNLPPIYGIRSQLVQVVTNLLVNALTYTKFGGVNVSTYLDSNTDQVCLEIKDSGIGIPAEDLKHVFSRFYRGHNVSQSNLPGSG
ncbi:MAG: GAF domain-containing protein, partial [Anaerolineae bacterium]